MKTKHRYSSRELCACLYHPRAAGSTWSGAGGRERRGRGGGRVEKATTIPMLEWICYGGRGVAGLGEKKLQLLPAHSYGRNFFPIPLFIQLQNFTRD